MANMAALRTFEDHDGVTIWGITPRAVLNVELNNMNPFVFGYPDNITR
jgi:hypothetical protein